MTARRVSLVVCVAAAFLAATTGRASAATVVAHGNAPDAVVDRDGVTHLVWNEGGESTYHADVLHYCQIPLGGSACTHARAFTPPADTWANIEVNGPRVMVTPFGEVLLLSNRVEQFLGRSMPNVVYRSDDGGVTFGAPTVVGTTSPGSSRAVFDGADRRVVTASARPDGVHFQAAPLGQWTEAVARLSTRSEPQFATVVQRERNSFAVAWQDRDLTIRVRTFTCSSDPCPLGQVHDEASWTPPVVVAEAELPQLTSGPAGTFLMYRSRATGMEGHYFLRRLDGATLGPALLVGRGSTDRRDIVEDPAGILHALFSDERVGLGYRSSADGGLTWGDQQTIAPGHDPAIDAVRVAARSTDDGFVGAAFWESDNGSLRNPPILRADLPPPSVSLRRTPRDPVLPPPPPVLPPPPPAACRLLTFAAVDVIADACLKREGDAYVATGAVKLNGLRVELGRGKLRLDPKKRTISSAGASVTVKIGDTVLFKSAISWTLPKASIASVGSVNVSGGGALLGFPLKGSAEIKFRGGGVEIPLHLGLPALFGGVTGDLTVRADNVAGVHVRDLHVKVGHALIGPLEIKDLGFDYDADEQSWAGAATLILPPQPPGPSLAGKIGFTRGELDYLRNELTLPGPGVVLDPFGATYLRRIRFELKTTPLQLAGGVTITAGPTIAGVAAVSVDGDLTFTLGNPATLRADGRVSVVGIPLAGAFFELRTNGYVGFGGRLGYELAGFKATANVDGWLFKSAFSLGAGASICLGDLGCAGGEVVFSSVGFAGCARTPIADFGAGYAWGKSLDFMFSGCDVGPYRASAAAAQAGRARTVSFGAGRPSGVIAVHGVGAPPHVTVVNPAGARFQDTPGAGTRTRTSVVFHNPHTNTTYFVVKAPRAGTWRIEPAPDSAPIAGVQSADGLKDPRVTGSVKRAGRGRVLWYKVTPLPGQKVTFAEQAKGAARPIGGTARNGRGTLRFTPADGPSGRRKIVALVSSFGKPRKQLTVATYVAPAPAKPARIKQLKARRLGRGLAVTWRKAANARRYEMRATLSDGRRLFARQKGTRLTIPAVAARTRATITVRGLKADGTRGKPSAVRIITRSRRAGA